MSDTRFEAGFYPVNICRNCGHFYDDHEREANDRCPEDDDEELFQDYFLDDKILDEEKQEGECEST